MKPDRERVNYLVRDTITLLCRNGLQFNKEIKVQGLLGITLDDDEVFLIPIDKSYSGNSTCPVKDVANTQASSLVSNSVRGSSSMLSPSSQLLLQDCSEARDDGTFTCSCILS